MKYLISTILSLSILLSASIMEAHPGRTDSSGGHTCRTNCPSWGLSYGEYHYHDGNSHSSSSSSSDSNHYEQQNDYNQGFAQGLNYGTIAYENDQTYEAYAFYGAGSSHYEAGFIEGFNESYNVEKQQDDYYEKGKTDGYNQLNQATASKNVPSAFLESYTNGFEFGSYKKQSELADQAYKQGFENGQNFASDKQAYNNPSIQASYNRGYEKGFEEKKTAITEEASQAANDLVPPKLVADESPTYQQIYTESYETAYKTKLESIEQEGFASAFQHDKVQIPEAYSHSDDAAAIYEQGFYANEEAKKIKDIAYNDGFWFVANNEQETAATYEHAKEIYELYYTKGKDEAVKLYKGTAIGGTALSVAAFALFKMMRRREKKKVGIE